MFYVEAFSFSSAPRIFFFIPISFLFLSFSLSFYFFLPLSFFFLSKSVCCKKTDKQKSWEVKNAAIRFGTEAKAPATFLMEISEDSFLSSRCHESWFEAEGGGGGG